MTINLLIINNKLKLIKTINYLNEHEVQILILHSVLDNSVTLIDTATMNSRGHNESFIAYLLK